MKKKQKQAKAYFVIKTVTLLKGTLEKQYGIDHKKKKHVTL